MVDLLAAGGHFRFAPSVDDISLLGAEALGAAGGVHGHIAAADNGGAFPHFNGGIGMRKVISFHQIGAGQKLIGAVYAVEVFSGDLHEIGQTGTAADVDGVETVIGLQLIQRQHFADDHIALDVHALIFQGFDLFFHQLFGEAELGDAVDQHAAGLVESFKDRHLIAQLDEISGHGETAGAAADDGDFFAVGFRFFRRGFSPGHGVIGTEPLQTADGHRLALFASDALSFALAFLRADTAADGRQGVGIVNDLIGFIEVAFLHLGDEFGDPHIDGTAADAGLFFASHTAGSFFHRHFGGVAQSHFLKIPIAHIRSLLRHFYFFRRFVICHHSAPPKRRHWCRSMDSFSSLRYILPRSKASAKST